MEYTYIRRLLDDAKTELGDLFSLGLSQGERYVDSLTETARRLNESGLIRGGELAGRLCESLWRSRIDTAWTAEESFAIYLELWEYLKKCLFRLDFLEATASTP
ncbi:hypothetical protein FACS1894127_7810 [Clostridia bacterium]|nr:hypothetical protein FACS1894127_7810 [Clostridia bacterium]